jgi:hypothetical protein
VSTLDGAIAPGSFEAGAKSCCGICPIRRASGPRRAEEHGPHQAHRIVEMLRARASRRQVHEKHEWFLREPLKQNDGLVCSKQ